MSKMAEMAMEIEDMFYDDNLDAHQIAKRTGLQVEDVAAFIDEMLVHGIPEDEPFDGFNSDAEADADALASAGLGTDEGYGCSAEDML